MIASHLEKVLNEYRDQATKTFSANLLAEFIRHTIPETLVKETALSENYLVKGSPGQGGWAEIPWVCIFDKSITESAQTGYYLVYLFDAHMNGVYLSLGIGWTQFREKYGDGEGVEKINKHAAYLKKLLKSTLSDFSFEPINLNAINKLGEGYEAGHVCGKYYSKTNMPADSVLINDFRNLLGVYRELKGQIGTDIFNLSILEDEDTEDDPPTLNEKLDIANKSQSLVSREDLNRVLSDLETQLAGKEPKVKTRIAKAIVRNKKIVDIVKKSANFKCAICGVDGFKKKDGSLYAEAHHIAELSISRLDLPSNLMCVCPTCHRILHYGNEEEISNRKIGQFRNIH